MFTQAALARMEAARNAVATVGAALPAFEVPRDASALNGTVNGDSVLQGSPKTRESWPKPRNMMLCAPRCRLMMMF